MITVRRFGLLLVLVGCQQEVVAPGDPRFSSANVLSPPADPAIAFVGGGGLSVMNADGSNQTVVVAANKTTSIGAGLPSWSPDAKHIVFGASIAGVTGLWIVDVSVVNGTPVGGSLHKLQITCPSGASTPGGAGPSWSPNGDVIALVAGCVQPWDGNIYVVPATGGTATVAYTSPSGFSPEWPAWSPDGSKLVFVERGDTGTTVPRALVVWDLNTSTRTELLSFSTTFFPKTPAWSNGGGQVAYSGVSGNSPEAVFTIAATGGTPVQVGLGDDPTWSADDAKLAFTGTISRKSGVVTLTLTGGAVQMLAAGGAHANWRRF